MKNALIRIHYVSSSIAMIRTKNILYIFVAAFYFLVSSNLNAQKSAKTSDKGTKKESIDDKTKLLQWNDYFELSSEMILENKVTGLAKAMAFTKKYPNNAAGYALLGDFHLENNQLSAAIDAYKKAIQIDHSERWFSLKLAKTYQLGSMYKEAIDIYEDLFKKNSQDPSPLFYVFQIYNTQKKYNEAASTLEKIKGSVGDSYEMSLDLQRIYFKAGNYKASLQELDNLKKMRPEDADNYGKAAEIYLAMGNKEKAMDEFSQVLKINPNDEQIHFSLAAYFSSINNWDKTVYHLGKGIGNAGIDIDKKIMILLSLMDANQIQKGIYSDSISQMVNVLTSVHPGSAKAYSIKGDFYMSTYDYKNAELAFTEVIKLDKNKWAVWSQLMYIKRIREEYASLLKISSEVQDLYPNNPESYLYKGIANVYLNNINKAKEEFESGEAMLFSIGELSSAFWVAKGEQANYEGNEKLIIAFYNKALDQSPGNVDAKIKLAYFYIANNKELNKAESLLSESEKQSLDLFYFYACKGLLHLRKNNPTEAEKMWTLAVKFGGTNHSWTQELEGDLKSIKGENSVAMTLWKNAQSKGWKSTWLSRKIEASKWIQ